MTQRQGPVYLFVFLASVASSCSEPQSPVRKPSPIRDIALTADGTADRVWKDTHNVTGNWRILMGRATWYVRLEPRATLPNEYDGTGTRTTPDEDGRDVTMGVGAIVEGPQFRAWLGAGLIVCKGRFSSVEPIEGTCTAIDGEPAGPLRAERAH